MAGSGFIERSFNSCATNDGPGGPITGSGELCWKNNNATMSFGGHSGQLIPTSTDGVWRLSDDDGSRIQHLTLGDGRHNGTYDDDYWVLTTSDGTRYFFGMGQLPGSGWSDTNSAWTVPVHGDDNGNTGVHVQGWRWNLDYVVDPHQNAEALFYTAQTNKYGASATTYTRGGTLDQILYGLRDGAAYTTTSASDKVVFTSVARCDTSATGDPATACSASSPTAADWPDTPWYENCTAATCTETSPSFFSTTMLSKVTSYVYANSAYNAVDTWTLTHSFPSVGTGATPALWLSQIAHTGSTSGSGTTGASTIQDRPTVFHSVSLNNRVVQADGLTLLPKLRIASIDTALGGGLLVNYLASDCTATVVASLNPATNTHRCYPQWWTPPGTPTPPAALDWFNKYVVSDVEQDPRTGGTGQLQLETDYKYLGTPAWRFDTAPSTVDGQRTWSSFAGYKNVEVRDGNSNAPALQHTTDYTFFQGLDGDPDGTVTDPTSAQRSASLTSGGTTVPDSLWWAGRVFETVSRNGSSGGTGQSSTAVLSDAVSVPWASSANASVSTTYRYTDPATSTVYTGSFITASYLTGDSSTTTTSPLSTGGSRVTSVSTGGYDAYGRATQVEDITPDAGTTCTRTSYATNSSAWLIDYASEVSVVGVGCSATPTYPRDALSDSQTYYDGAGTVAGQSPTRGDVTQTRVVNGYTGTTAETATWLTTTTSATTDYDSLGRLLKVTDQLGRTNSTSYTPSDHGPLTSSTSTNTLGWTTSATVNPAWGAPISSTDVNGHVTTETYDAMGRLAQAWGPDWSQSAHPTVPTAAHTYTLSGGQPNVVTTSSVTAAGASLTSYSLFDGLGRPVQTQAPAEGGGSDIVDTSYDGEGQPSLVTAPYVATSSPSATLVVPTLVPSSQTKTVYDGAGRTTATVLMSGVNEAYRTSYSYLGTDRVDMTPPAGGTPTSTYTDSRGSTVALTQYLASTPLATAPQEKTTYGFDARGDQVRMTDPAGHNWTWSFDVLGRQYSATDPDTGTITTTYDAANRVTSTTDAGRVTTAGQAAAPVTLAYGYDSLDRKTGEYLGSTTGTKLASWSYDPSFGSGTTAYTAKGQLGSSTRWVGSTGYTSAITGYDAVNRATGRTVTIPGSTALAGSYTTSATYGPDGSMLSQTDPAVGGLLQEKLVYGYDSNNNPSGVGSTVGSIASSIAYTNLGQVSQIMQSQGAQTWRTNYWDPVTLRLNEVLTQRNATANAVVSDDTYTYTNAGDVTSDKNTTTAAGTDTQCYSYDNLHELTAAWTPSSNTCTTAPSATMTFGGPAPYWDSWQVDPATGNRSTATQHATTSTGTDSRKSFTYSTTQPHTAQSVVTATAPAGSSTYTTTNTATYGYDADGDTTSRPNQTLTYTPDGSLNTVTVAGGSSQSNIYDADGNLLLQTDTSTSTLFLGDTDVHLAAGGTAASATRTYSVLGLALGERDSKVGVTGSHLYFLDPNIDNTVTAYVDTATAAVTRRYQDPYGNSRGTNPAWISNRSYLDKTLDATTGLTHVGAREYDATLGRFLTADSVLDPGNPLQNNGYSYSRSNPVTTSDPSGLMAACEGPCHADNNPNKGSTPKGNTPPPPAPGVSAGGSGAGNGGGCGQDACANRPGLAAGGGAYLTWRHDTALNAARIALQRYTRGEGIISANVAVPNGSKTSKRDAFGLPYTGFADLTWEDPTIGVMWIWEVKIVGVNGIDYAHALATEEAAWYVYSWNRSRAKRPLGGYEAMSGFAIPGLPTATGWGSDTVDNSHPDLGGLLYGTSSKSRPQQQPQEQPQPDYGPSNVPQGIGEIGGIGAGLLLLGGAIGAASAGGGGSRPPELKMS